MGRFMPERILHYTRWMLRPTHQTMCLHVRILRMLNRTRNLSAQSPEPKRANSVLGIAMALSTLFAIVQPAQAEPVYSKLKEDKAVSSHISLYLNRVSNRKNRDKKLSVARNTDELNYGCNPGFYIWWVRNGAICCPNGSRCSIEGYCY